MIILAGVGAYLGFRPLTGIKASLTISGAYIPLNWVICFRPLTGIKASLTSVDC